MSQERYIFTPAEKARLEEQRTRENCDRAFMSENWSEFKQLYPEKFVIVKDATLIGTSDSLIDLVEALKERKIDITKTTIEFVHTRDLLLTAA